MKDCLLWCSYVAWFSDISLTFLLSILSVPLTGACIVLHNIAILLKEPLPEDDPEEPDDGADVVCDQAEDGRRVRDFITRTYFTV